jgi:catechol 2,3-dioxygenase-like lactoylglutathione lyase family enzyme
MSRIQLALNVTDLDAAIAFYSKLFGTEPAKLRPGYANFAIADPPLKLVLFENEGPGATINHLGVEVASTDDVNAATERLTGEGLATLTEDQTACCYALQDKVWVTDPDGARWEVYTVLENVETVGCTLSPSARDERSSEIGALLGPALVDVQRSEGAVRIALRDRPGLDAEVRDLIEKERQCCSFLEFSVDRAADILNVDISGPAEAADTLDAFAGIASLAPVTVPAGEPATDSCC